MFRAFRVFGAFGASGIDGVLGIEGFWLCGLESPGFRVEGCGFAAFSAWARSP